MPLIRKEGKDTIIFASKEEHSTPSKVDLPEAEPSPGLLLPNGDINWNCPCLGGMATGPCGLEFREAFSCFHYSSTDPKGSDCVNAFKTMQVCMAQYPALYGNKETSADDMDDDLDPIDDSDNKGFSITESTGKQKDVSSIKSDAAGSKGEERPDTSTSKKQVERTNVN